jgi:hypothetical protein
MAHAQKPDFVFRRNGRVHLNRPGLQSTIGSRGVRISGSNGSNDGYTMFRSSVKSTGYPLHSPVSPSLPLPCVTACHQISTGLYWFRLLVRYYSATGNLRAASCSAVHSPLSSFSNYGTNYCLVDAVNGHYMTSQLQRRWGQQCPTGRSTFCEYNARYRRK